MAEFSDIRFDVSERVATIELHRPDALNAWTPAMVAEMLRAFDLADADDGVRAVVVTGAGDRAFCAGADLSGDDPFSAGDDVERNADGVPRDGAGLVTLRVFASRKPVIAAINGAAVGVGATMTLPMDIRLASTTARFGFVFNRVGIVPEGASSWFLPRLVGISKALEWCYSGRLFSADEAQAAGLVTSVHAPAELLDAARAVATEIAEHTAAVSIALTRQMMWRMLGADHPMDAHRVESRALFDRMRSADAAEGVAAFIEKRAATFTGQVSSDFPDVFTGWPELRYE